MRDFHSVTRAASAAVAARVSAPSGSVSRVEWIATGIAVVAALIAGWQAWEARRARLDARSSASEAQDHEARAVAASERIAAAIEEQNNREREERERYKNPWTMVPEYVKSGRRWKFHLGGDERVTGVTVKVDDKYEKERLSVTMPETEDMRPGQSFRLDWWRSMASPQQITAELHWVRANGEAKECVVTLD